MKDRKDHMQNRGAIETVLRYIPGFRGYLEKEYRRESDELERQWLARRLGQGLRGLNDYLRSLADSGQLAELPAGERLRKRLDRLIDRITSAMQGYSGMFDLVRIDVAALDRVYTYDAGLVDQVERLAESLEQLAAKPQPPGEVLPGLLSAIGELEEAWDQREDILKGLE